MNLFPVNMPEQVSIGPEPAQFWHITACLQGSRYHVELNVLQVLVRYKALDTIFEIEKKDDFFLKIYNLSPHPG